MKEWWRGAVIYQVYPRSFCDSDADGIGDLPGITGKLQYIADLGVDAIWISPFFKSPMKDFGYDVEDYYAVDPIFGDLDDFDALVRKAHSLGLKVIIDQVYSHTSDRCAWFRESRRDRNNPRADWYVWADAKSDGSPPNNWRSMFGGPAWSWDSGRGQYYMHNFLPGQPDLNLHNPAVRQGLLDIARFWLDRGVDGFRLDAANHYMHDPALRDNPDPHASMSLVVDGKPPVFYNTSHPDTLTFIKEVRATFDQYPERFSVAEVGGAAALEDIRYYTEGSDRIDSAIGFVLVDTGKLSAGAIKAAVSYWNDFASVWPSWAFSNHDRPRVVTRWGDGHDPVKLARMLQTLLVTLRGTVFLYQGEELGLPQADIKFEQLKDPQARANWPDTMGRDGARTPMPWHGRDKNGGWIEDAWMAVDESHFGLCVDRQLEDADSPLAHCHRLLQFRKEHPALAEGSIEFIEGPDDILAFVRAGTSETVLCVFNLGVSEQQWLPEIGEAEVSGDWLFVFNGADRNEPALLPPLSGYVTAVGVVRG